LVKCLESEEEAGSEGQLYKQRKYNKFQDMNIDRAREKHGFTMGSYGITGVQRRQRQEDKRRQKKTKKTQDTEDTKRHT